MPAMSTYIAIQNASASIPAFGAVTTRRTPHAPATSTCQWSPDGSRRAAAQTGWRSVCGRSTQSSPPLCTHNPPRHGLLREPTESKQLGAFYGSYGPDDIDADVHAQGDAGTCSRRRVRSQSLTVSTGCHRVRLANSEMETVMRGTSYVSAAILPTAETTQRSAVSGGVTYSGSASVRSALISRLALNA